MTTIRQSSFSRGIIDKGNRARVDLVDYGTGLRDLRNFITRPGGGATNRPGFKFIAETRYPTKRVKTTPFIFSDDASQTYQIEWGDLYAEFIQNGARVVEASQSITSITKANPPVVTYVGADPSNGDDILITGGAMSEIVGRRLRIKNVNAGANTFELTDLYGVNINSTTYTTYAGGGVFNRIYKIVTKYLEAHLQDLDYDQSADILILTHKEYYTQQLVRTGHTNWTLTFYIWAPDIGRPGSCAAVRGAAGANTYQYHVHAVDAFSGEESLPGTITPVAITAITATNPPVVTAIAHGITNGMEITLDLIVGMDELNKRTFIAANVTANTLELRLARDGATNVDATGYKAWVSGGTVARTYAEVTAAAAPTVPAPIVVSWTAVPGAARYKVYRFYQGVWAFVGSTSLLTLNDEGTPLPDATILGPLDQYLFDSPNNWPAAVASYQRRMVFASTKNRPDSMFMTQTGHYGNLTLSTPSRDTDAITTRLRSGQVNAIKRMVPLSKILTFSTGAEWTVGSSGGGLSENTLETLPNSFNGTSGLKPVISDGVILYMQDRGTRLRDTTFDWRQQTYDGFDRSIRAQHLFDGSTIVDMAFQKVPYPVLWMPKADGTMIGFTYMPKEEVFGFHRHDTDGTIENVCSVPESGEYALYLVVKRTISGQVRRYIERMASPLVGNMVDVIRLDSALTYDGRNTTAITMTLTSAGGWDYGDTLTLTASSGFFVAGDVGNAIHMTGPDGTVIRCQIVGYTSATVVSVRPHKTVPVSMRGVALTTWAKAVYRIGGLWHLEGKAVSVLGDGGVVASPTGSMLTVTNGAITLPANEPRVVIQIGLPYFYDLWTLDLNDVRNPKDGEQKLVNNVKLDLEDSAGGFVGGEPPTNDAVDAFQNLDEIKYTSADDEGEIPELLDEVIDQNISGRWNKHGRVFVRGADPVPFTIRSISPTGIF